MGLLDRLRPAASGAAPVPGPVDAVLRAVDHEDWHRSTAEKVRETEAFASLREAQPHEQMQFVLDALALARQADDYRRADCADAVASELLRPRQAAAE